MRIKAAIAGALLVVMSVAFAACGGAEDGEITTTTTKAPATSAVRTTRPNTTNGSALEELSSAAGDVSEGLSDTVSELGSGLRNMFD